MVAIAVCASCPSAQVIDPFLAMLPVIRRTADKAFYHVRLEAREELVAEVVAIALKFYRRLAELGKAALAYPTVLAKYAIRHVRHGRALAGRLNTFDVTSPYAQRRKAIRVRSLDAGRSNGDWEQLVQCRKATPAEIAVVRVDFRDWLRRLRPQQRRIALRLAAGESTSEAAARLGVTSGRISQIRHELKRSWEQYHGEPFAM